MNTRHKRKLRNFLIDKSFQIPFILRFVFVTFLMVLLAGSFQFFIFKKTIEPKYEKIKSVFIEERKLLDRITSYFQEVEKKPNMSHNLEQEKRFKREIILEKEDIVKKSQSILNEIKKEHTQFIKSGIISLFTIGLFLNLLIMLIYGLLLSHRLAGNNYRINLFAKQLQQKNLKHKLSVRNRDFFKETAFELDEAREIIRNDLAKAKDGNTDCLSSYTL